MINENCRIILKRLIEARVDRNEFVTFIDVKSIEYFV